MSTRLSPNRLNTFGLSHIGRVKTVNEDRYLIHELEDDAMLLAVADGLGGEVAGDVAAEWVRHELSRLDCVPRGREQSEISQLARNIDQQIYNQGRARTELKGMASTLICVVLRATSACWVHVGDSRLYLLREGRTTQLTEDQTLARFLVAEGEIDPEEVSSHYSRHVMDQCVGCGYIEPETGCIGIRAGDVLLLSSDGLHDQISDQCLHALLKSDDDLKQIGSTLVKSALAAGGADNITVVLAAISK